MFYVPLYIEALRSRPNLLFWAAALAQATIWVVVPMVFYAAPPGDLPQLLKKQLSIHSGLPNWFNPGILLAARFIYGVRTDDLVLGKHALYQLSYTRSPNR